MIAWSYGGGIQSVAIGVLIKAGELPMPDLAGIADTSREMQSTWDYLHNVMQPYLAEIGLTIEVVPHDLARVDLYDKTGLTLVPAWTDEGRLSAFCSGEWKRDVMERWLRLKGVKDCDSWIGYSIDELRRVPKKDHRHWCRLQFPLIDKMLTRAACRSIILAAGLPLPSKSRCWCCPHQDEEEWAEVQASPEEWAKAIALEKEINECDPEQKGLYLWAGRVPLEQADFGAAALRAPGRPCEATGCWT
jgi:hypothetical protein